MDVLKIALLQIEPEGSINNNLKKGIEYCKKAKSLGADIALFPEMWSIGYNIYNREVAKWQGDAIDITGDFVNAFKKLSGELQMAIGITFLQKTDDLPLNTLCVFDRFSKLVLEYSKVHTCDFSQERNLKAGDDFYVGTLNTEKGNVEIGAMICYDREFPESARILMLKGAELVLVPNASPMEINRLSQLRGRAFENMMAIATCNYPSVVPDCNGMSTVFDGVAYLPNLNGSRDTCILQADCSEGIYVAELNLKQLRDYRKEEVHGNAFRHPKKYKILTDTEINPPFIRAEYRE